MTLANLGNRKWQISTSWILNATVPHLEGLADYGIPEHILENEAIQNGKAIIGRLLYELHQVEGLFSDNDGNIATAMSEAEAFIYPPSLLLSFPVRKRQKHLIENPRACAAF